MKWAGLGQDPSPASFPSLPVTYSAEAKARKPLSGPYRCCLRWRAFGGRPRRACPWRVAHPWARSEAGSGRALGVDAEGTEVRPSYSSSAGRALPPRAPPPAVVRLAARLWRQRTVRQEVAVFRPLGGARGRGAGVWVDAGKGLFCSRDVWGDAMAPSRCFGVGGFAEL